MIAVVLAQIASRWGQAATLLVLSLAVTVAAVSVPLYAVSVDRASVENELGAAESSELVVSMGPLRAGASGAETEPAGQSDSFATGPVQMPDDLSALAEIRAELAAFTPVTTVGIHVQGLGDDESSEDVLPRSTHRMLARDDFCQHMTLTDGRCPVGSREVAIPVELADETGVSPGEEAVLTPVRPTEGGGWEPDGPPVSVTLVGVFEPDDPDDPYWASQDPLGSQSHFTPAIVTNRTVVQTLPHGHATVYVDAILPPHVLAPERIGALRQQLQAAEQRIDQNSLATDGLTTKLPQLLDRIEGHGDQARALLPIAATPLIVLGWFVVYLAVGHGVSGRRHEVGAVALRGAKWWTRAMAIAAESLLPVLAGVPAGLVIALVAVAGPGGVGPVGTDGAQLLAAGLAAAGTIAAALIALRRELAAPIVQLLRAVPPRRRRVAVTTTEVLVVVLGVVVVADLWAFDDELAGVMVAAPVIVMLAVGVLAARAVRPLIDLAGRWSLRRGRVGQAMAALYLARRPGLARLLAVLTLVLGTLGFAAAATDVAAQGRVAEAQRGLGAARVLEIRGVDRAELLQAVRAADPSGRDAMAVVSAPGSGGDPPVVAVDSTRLASVALWSERYGRPGPTEVAEMLRPPAPEPLLVSDGELVAELSLESYTKDERLTVSVLLAPVGGDPVVARFDPVVHGQLTYRTRVTRCADGCRLVGVIVAASDSTGGVTLGALRQRGQDVIPPERLTDTSWWRGPEGGTPVDRVRAEATREGLLLSGPQSAGGNVLLVLDVPYPLPVVSAGAPVAGELLTNVDAQPIRFAPQASLTGLPGLGATGTLMDLEYAERLTAEPGDAISPEVWLAEGAATELIDELRDQGLVIAGERTVETQHASLDESGAAITLRFYRLAAWVAVLVGVGALALAVAVDRRTWNRGMRALRAQGVTGATTTAAAVWSYGGTVVTGAVAGVLAGSAAWLAAGDKLPLGVDQSLVVDGPRWAAQVMMAPGTVAIVLLLPVVVVGAWRMGRGAATLVTTQGDSRRTGGG